MSSLGIQAKKDAARQWVGAFKHICRGSYASRQEREQEASSRSGSTHKVIHDGVDQKWPPSAKDKMFSVPAGKALLHNALDPGRFDFGKVPAVNSSIRPQHQGDPLQVELGLAEILGVMFSVTILLDLLEVDGGVRYIFPPMVRDG